MADQKGTGKHAHKSTEEPYPYHEGQSSGKQSESSNETRGSSRTGSEASDLKEREYRDAQGNIHHHTRTAKEEQKK
jgi:hypothetical protein